MLLTSADITTKKIVHAAKTSGLRPTTYDATVGEIIYGGAIIKEQEFTLESRGVVWVVSEEEFHLPDNVTGLATLKTTWTHDGVLALNVGVIDPGWEGPVATALVNFGKNDFVVTKGKQFFRILFHEHAATGEQPNQHPKQTYLEDIVRKSRSFSPEFLNMNSLADEVSTKILKLPRWAYLLTIIAIVISVLAIYMPISWSVGTEHYQGQARIENLEKQIEALKQAQDEIKKKEDSPATQQKPTDNKKAPNS
jgi:deoxycytidine triphosphate deaminase